MKVALLLTAAAENRCDDDALCEASLLAKLLSAQPGVVADVLTVPFASRSLPGWLTDVQRLAAMDFSGFDVVIPMDADALFANHPIQIFYAHRPLPLGPYSVVEGRLGHLLQRVDAAMIGDFCDDYRAVLEIDPAAALAIPRDAVSQHFRRAALARRCFVRIGAPSTPIQRGLSRLGAHENELVWFDHPFARLASPPDPETDVLLCVFDAEHTVDAALAYRAAEPGRRVRVACAADAEFERDLSSLLPAGSLIRYRGFWQRLQLMLSSKQVIGLGTATLATDVRAAVAHGVQCVSTLASAWADSPLVAVADVPAAQLINQRVFTCVPRQHLPAATPVEWLLPSALRGGVRRSGVRRRIVSVSTYPVWPVRSGGQSRIANLFGELARHADIDLLTFAEPWQPSGSHQILPGLVEHCVPMSSAHAAEEAKLRERVGFNQIGDIAFPDLAAHSPEFLNRLRQLAAGADLIVASHPYGIAPLLNALKLPLVHDSHNAETALKRAMLPDTPAARALVDRLEQLEISLIQRARLVSACSQSDIVALQKASGQPADHFVFAPNGVDVRAVPYVSPEARSIRRVRFGLTARVGLFMGSWHAPNVVAVEKIFDIAQASPSIEFVVAGSVCLAPFESPRPSNVRFLGVVDEATKRAWLGVSDFALNPMQTGSGTNLKMLDYFAAGLPVVTTEIGCRGLDVAHGVHAWVCDTAQFNDGIREVLRTDVALTLAQAGRGHVESHFDWRHIAQNVWTAWRDRQVV